MKKSMILLKKMIQSIADKTAFVTFSPEGVASDFEKSEWGIRGLPNKRRKHVCTHMPCLRL